MARLLAHQACKNQLLHGGSLILGQIIIRENHNISVESRTTDTRVRPVKGTPTMAIMAS